MKNLKIFSAAALAGVALLAFSGEASADVLCKAAPNASGECSTTSGDYAAGTTFTAEATNPKFTISGSSVGVTTVTCPASFLTFESTSTGSNTSGQAVTGEVHLLVFSTLCESNNKFSCGVEAAVGFKLKLTATADNGNGHVRVEETFGKKIKVNCLGGGFGCEYEVPGGSQLPFTGGNPASISISSLKLIAASGGFGCGTEGKWDATYNLNGSNPAVWIATKNA